MVVDKGGNGGVPTLASRGPVVSKVVSFAEGWSAEEACLSVALVADTSCNKSSLNEKTQYDIRIVATDMESSLDSQ